MLNGKPFSELPVNTEIETLAAATVGITSGQGQRCTGVAIANDLLLTAQHCLFNLNEQKQSINVGDNITLTVATNNSMVKSVKFVAYAAADLDQLAAFSGNDIAIIKFEPHTFQKIIPENKIINTKIYAKDEIINELAKQIWDRPNILYTMGWGSNKEFQVISQASNDEKFPHGFKTGITNGDQIIIDSYNLPINGKYSIWEYDSDNHSTYKLFTETPTKASLSNVLVMENDTEYGDSGGPVFTCDKHGNNCSLIALTSSYAVDDDSSYDSDDEEEFSNLSYVITLANPFYDKVYTEILHH